MAIVFFTFGVQVSSWGVWFGQILGPEGFFTPIRTFVMWELS